MKRLALQNMRVRVLRIAFGARKFFGSFEKRTHGRPLKEPLTTLLFLISNVIFCITDQRGNLNHVVKETKELLQCYASYRDHLANFFFKITS